MLGPDELRHIARVTLAHYDHAADAFWEGTATTTSARTSALLSRLEAGAVRDPRPRLRPRPRPVHFRDLGHEAVGLDGAARFVDMARAHTGCEVLHQDFLALDLPRGHFDGVFANASLFHVPAQELPRVLGELRPRSARAASSSARTRTGRHRRLARRALRRVPRPRDVAMLVVAAGFVELDHYYRPPGLPRSQQPWLATVWRKA